MSFKEGKFYAIQGRTRSGDWVFLESMTAPLTDHRARLRSIAKKASRPKINSWDDDEYDYQEERNIKISESPYSLKLFESKTMQVIMAHMRHIRANCGSADIDPTTLRLVTVETKVETFVPEPESEDEIEMRKFALDKLSDAEKDLLKLRHWDVYHKLSDRSMLDDDEDDNG